MILPVNILDKVKYELNKRNSPQYFFTFSTYEGEIEENKLKEAFQKLYDNNEKLNSKLHFDGKNYHYNLLKFEQTFHCLEADETITPAEFVEKQAKTYITMSKEAPVLLILLKGKTSYSLLFLHNHIYYDGTTAYLLQHHLISYYNGEEPFPNLLPLSDLKAIESRKKQIHSFSKAKYGLALLRHLCSSLRYSSSLNKVVKIYQRENKSKVFFHYFTIPHPKGKSNNLKSTNTIVCSFIAKTFLALKGKQTAQEISIAIPSNFRDEALMNRLGNLVYSISVKLKNEMSLIGMQEKIQKKTALMKRYREIAAYQLLHTLASAKVGHQLITVFSKISKKHHCYITNLGDYSKRFTSAIGQSKLLTSGGFNFPIQEDYGLVFTVVPHGDKIGVGIASSSLVFSKEELQTFENHLLKISTFS